MTHLRDDPAGLVLAVHTADRFGENGLVGAVLGRRADDGLHLENMLLSCRVFSRGIEQAVLSVVLHHARDAGAAAVWGRYRRTAKNHTVADLLPRYGFAVADGPADDRLFRHDLVDIVAPPEHLRLTADLG